MAFFALAPSKVQSCCLSLAWWLLFGSTQILHFRHEGECNFFRVSFDGPPSALWPLLSTIQGLAPALTSALTISFIWFRLPIQMGLWLSSWTSLVIDIGRERSWNWRLAGCYVGAETLLFVSRYSC